MFNFVSIFTSTLLELYKSYSISTNDIEFLYDTTTLLNHLIYDRVPYHLETSPLICCGFYMIGTSIMKDLKLNIGLKWVNGYSVAGNCMFKVNNSNTRIRCEKCSKLTIKTPEQRCWRCSGVCIFTSEHISYLVLVFLLLALNRLMPAGKIISYTVIFLVVLYLWRCSKVI